MVERILSSDSKEWGYQLHDFAPHWDEVVKGLAVEILEQSCLQKASQETTQRHNIIEAG